MTVEPKARALSLVTDDVAASLNTDPQPSKAELMNTQAGTQYIGGGDWRNGLPTADKPVTHRTRAAGGGLDWNTINARYVENGGQIDDSVWPNANGKVVVVGEKGQGRHRLHTWVEAEGNHEETATTRGRVS